MKFEKEYNIPEKYLKKYLISRLKKTRDLLYLLKNKEETDMFCALRIKGRISDSTNCQFIQESGFNCEKCFFYKENLKAIHYYFKKYIDNEDR